MNQNSNIRRIDELGRIVIPKDIRKKLHIRDNEPLEIFIEDQEIKIKKYSSLPDIIEYINTLLDIGNRTTDNSYILTNRETILSSSDADLVGATLPVFLDELVLTCREERNIYKEIKIGEKTIAAHFNIIPIIIDNDRSGLLLEYNATRELDNLNIIKIFKNLIEKRLNNY